MALAFEFFAVGGAGQRAGLPKLWTDKIWTEGLVRLVQDIDRFLSTELLSLRRDVIEINRQTDPRPPKGLIKLRGAGFGLR